MSSYNLGNHLTMKIVGTMIHDHQFGGGDGVAVLEQYAPRAVQLHPHGGSIRFRLAPRTYNAPPCGPSRRTCGASPRDVIKKNTHPQNITALFRDLIRYQGWLTGGRRASCKAFSKGYGAVAPESSPRGPSHRGATEVCLNHLFTHTAAGGVLGVAIQANPASFLPGGICAPLACQGNNTIIATNAAFTNTMGEDGHLVPAWQSSLSTAHEFGHNLGANHDCAPRGPFKTTPVGGNSILFGSLHVRLMGRTVRLMGRTCGA